MSASAVLLWKKSCPSFFVSGAIRDAECQFVCKDHRVVDVYFSAVGVYREPGDLLHILMALVDITARKRAEAAEREQRTLAEALRDTAAALSSTLRFEEVLGACSDQCGQCGSA